MKIESVLPIVEIKNGKNRYDLHWDYVEDESNYILLETEYEYHIRGYFQGYFDALSDGKEKIACLTSSTGTIRNLSKENAEKLKTIISNKLHTIVKMRHKEITAYNNLPHIKFKNKEVKSHLYQ